MLNIKTPCPLNLSLSPNLWQSKFCFNLDVLKKYPSLTYIKIVY